MPRTAVSLPSAKPPIAASGAVALLRAMGLSAVQVSSEVVALRTTLAKIPKPN